MAPYLSNCFQFFKCENEQHDFGGRLTVTKCHGSAKKLHLSLKVALNFLNCENKQHEVGKNNLPTRVKFLASPDQRPFCGPKFCLKRKMY